MKITNWFGVFFTFVLPFLLIGLVAAGERRERRKKSKMLTCKALIDYLSRFPAEEGVSVIIVDIEKRLHHITGGYDLLDESPALLIETTESEPLDEIAEEITDEP